MTYPPTPGASPAGWYSHPDGGQTYWDGERWVRPVAAVVPPRPSWFKSNAAMIIVVGVLVLAGGGVAVWYFGIRTGTMTVRGTLDIQGTKADGRFTVDAPDTAGNTTCEGSDGYSDISQGVAVKVTDSNDKTVGTGSLEAGIWIRGTGACIFGWQVTVPDDLDSYGVTVSHRGTLQFTRAEMKSGADLTLAGS